MTVVCVSGAHQGTLWTVLAFDELVQSVLGDLSASDYVQVISWVIWKYNYG